MTTESPVLRERRADGVEILRLNRPDKRNALDSESLALFTAALDELSADDELPESVTLGRPVGAGELLPRAALRTAASAALTEVPLTLGADAAPASVRVGSTVDVWVTPERGARDVADPSSAAGSPARAQLVFDDVSVVGSDPRFVVLGGRRR